MNRYDSQGHAGQHGLAARDRAMAAESTYAYNNPRREETCLGRFISQEMLWAGTREVAKRPPKSPLLFSKKREVDLSVKDGGSRAGHIDQIFPAVPENFQITAQQFYGDGRIPIYQPI